MSSVVGRVRHRDSSANCRESSGDFRFSGVIAGAILVASTLSPVVTLRFQGGSFAITPLLLTVLTGLAITTVHALNAETSSSYRGFSFVTSCAFAAVVLMALPSLYATVLGPAILAYVNFCVGVIAGVLVALGWWRSNAKSINVVDLGAFFFVASTAVQIVVAYVTADELVSVHSQIVLAWGQSNYVAGVMAVFSMLLVARATLAPTKRSIFWAFALLALVCCLLTLSRGGAVAASAGFAGLLWFLPQRRVSKVLFRSVAVLLPFVAWQLTSFYEDQRSAFNSQVYQNIDTRFELYAIAARSFWGNPVFGTGWASFRQATSVAVEEHTFAHNIVLSYLQIGGLVFGGASLAVLVVIVVRACRESRQIIPAVMAVLAISMTDPFTEGTAGAMATWAALGMGCVWVSFQGTSARPISTEAGATGSRSFVAGECQRSDP